MSAEEVDAYLASVAAAHRAALTALRAAIRKLVPEAEEIISYRIPAFHVEGGVVAGFAAFKSHMSYFPFSGAVLGELSEEIAGYAHTKSALHFSVERQLSDHLVELLITARRREIRSRGR